MKRDRIIIGILLVILLSGVSIYGYMCEKEVSNEVKAAENVTRHFYSAIKNNDFEIAISLLSEEYNKEDTTNNNEYTSLERDSIRLGELLSYKRTSWAVLNSRSYGYERSSLTYKVRYSKHSTEEKFILEKSENGIYQITERNISIIK